MTFNDLKDAILIGFFLAFMIGPVFFKLLQTSILKGFRAAIAFDLGVVLGDIVFILIAYYGSRSLLEKIKDDPRLFFVGGIILFIYGLLTFLNKKMKDFKQNKEIIVEKKSNYTKLFLEGFLLNFINIGVLAFWLGLIVVIGPNLQMDSVRIFNFFTASIVTYFIIDIGKIVLAKQLKSKLTPLIIYKIKRGMGILLMIFGIALFAKGFLPKTTLDVNKMIEQRKD